VIILKKDTKALEADSGVEKYATLGGIPISRGN
jgi:hypothetical protein